MMRFALFFLLVCSLSCFGQNHIEWKGPPVKLAEKGCYARIIRIGDSKWIAAFEDLNGNVVVSFTEDGISWSPTKIVFPFFTRNSIPINAANADICCLRNGALLCTANYRPKANGVIPYSIAISRSNDGGLTWTTPDILYSAGTRSCNGCWEPAFLELPDGTIHIYFADEGPYIRSSEQQISFISSTDCGITWTSPSMVCFRARHRDGMPVACIFGDEIVVAIEDNADGEFKPYTVRTSIDAPWEVPIWGNSPQREYALSESLSKRVYAGAPYLCKSYDGRAILSYQLSERKGLKSAIMEVAVGDNQARNFTSRSRPFGGNNGLWGSVAMWNDSTIVAVTSASLDGSMTAPWIRFGTLEQ